MKYWETITERRPEKKIEWPDGKRLAVLVAFDYQSEAGPKFMADGKTPHMGQITEWSYGGRVAIWRILDILDRQGIKGTFNTVGITAEMYPESVKAIVDRGHEIAGHSYDHVPQWNLSEKDEREQIRKTVAAIKKVTGQQIKGWRCPTVQPSPNTLRLLAEEGFVWDSNFLNDDKPYMLQVGGRELVEIPYTFSTDDVPFLYGSGNYAIGGFPAIRNIPRHLFEVQKDEFDILYQESAVDPKMFIFQTHPEVMGRAHRSKYFEMILAHIKSHEGIWFATLSEVAEWWIKKKY